MAEEEGEGVANRRKGSQCGVFRVESPLPRGRRHGATTIKVGDLRFLSSCLMRHERWGLRTELNPAASSRHQSSELKEARTRYWPQKSQPSAAGTWNMRKTLEQCSPLFTLISMKPFPVQSEFSEFLSEVLQRLVMVDWPLIP